jgi:cell division protease FtsH
MDDLAPSYELSPEELRHVAVHEAGHFVVAHHLGLSPEGVSIVADVDEGEAGHCIIPDPLIIQSAWDEEGRWRSEAAAVRGRIIAFMAGGEAEVQILGEDAVGLGDDERWIWRMINDVLPRNAPDEEFGRLERRLRRFAQTLVRRHRAEIECLADALLERNALTAAEVEELLAARG